MSSEWTVDVEVDGIELDPTAQTSKGIKPMMLQGPACNVHTLMLGVGLLNLLEAYLMASTRYKALLSVTKTLCQRLTNTHFKALMRHKSDCPLSLA